MAVLILTTNGEALVTKNVRFVDNTYASRGAEPLRMVRGTVNTNGSIVAGAGFGVSHTNGTGAYVITFSQPFGGTPTVTTSAVNFVTKSGSAPTPGSVTVATVDFSGHSQDDAFSFTALGPP
jgi:hypothetical protein